MNVVYASNENYVRHMAASIVSLFEQNRKRKRLTVYVLSLGIAGESRELLDEMAGRYGREICWLELGDIREQFDFGIDTGGFDVSTMARLFVGRLLPQQVRRVLYLDCDTVVTRPLGGLWNSDLEGMVLGAVMEPTIYRAVRQEIGLKEGDPYVNAGVLLIDLERWRQSGAEKRLLDFYREKGGSLFACDQDIINGVLKGQIHFLPPCYNFFTNYRYFSYGELVRQSAAYRAVSRGELARAKRSPVIIHYAGDERPWIAGNCNHYRRAYEDALALTPWAGTPKETGREAYMLAYHLMDYITVICPAARRWISSTLGMKMVNARKVNHGRNKDGEKVTSGPEGIKAETGSPGWEAAGDAGGEARKYVKEAVTEPAEKTVAEPAEKTIAESAEENAVKEAGQQILVLLAAYQGADYIAEQLDSILSQTVQGIRILISDDGSTDGTREILEHYREKYPERIVLRHRDQTGKFRNREEQVPAPAMNFFWLLSQAEADYVLLSDQDDVWHPQKVEKMLEWMHDLEAEEKGRRDLPMLVFSDMEVVDARLQQISPSFFAYGHCHPNRLSLSEILVENPVTGGALMINRALARMVADPPDACFMHDWWIALCAVCFGEACWVPEPLSQYRQHEHNTLGARNTGSIEDLKERCRRQKQVKENYRRMFCQASAFGRKYRDSLDTYQKRVLHEFLSLPGKTAVERLRSIVRYRFWKSSRLQTLAQCLTIPR